MMLHILFTTTNNCFIFQDRHHNFNRRRICWWHGRGRELGRVLLNYARRHVALLLKTKFNTAATVCSHIMSRHSIVVNTNIVLLLNTVCRIIVYSIVNISISMVLLVLGLLLLLLLLLLVSTKFNATITAKS